MKNRAAVVAASVALLVAVSDAGAQVITPNHEQIGRDQSYLRQEAERQQSQQMQQQQNAAQQQRDQMYQDNLNRNNAIAAGQAAQGRAVLQSWQRRPPLPPAQNALLGRWNSRGVGARQNVAGVPPEMARAISSIMGGITGGLCDSMLGRGTVEFRPDRVVAIGADGRERTLYRAEYRGEGSRVVVLPQPGMQFTHMIVDLAGNRGTVAAVGCVIDRSGGPSTAAGPAPAAAAVLASASVGPSNSWSLLGRLQSYGGVDVYLARERIERAGPIAQVWDLWDFKSTQSIAGHRVMSTSNHYAYDCTNNRVRMLDTSGFAGHMGHGTLVASEQASLPWQALPQNGPLFEEWKVACART